MMYEQFKAYIMPDKQRQTGARKFVAGSLAGCTAVILTYPFDLVRVRLAFETSAPKKGIWEICKIIYAEPLPRQFMSWSRLVVVPVEPIQFLNFYRGIVPSVLGMVPYAGIFMTVLISLLYRRFLLLLRIIKGSGSIHRHV